MTILGSAHSNSENSGTGYDEPQLMALSYGKGMIFHHTAGHDVVGMSSVDFGVLLLRGIEWAASGKVTQNVPPYGNHCKLSRGYSCDDSYYT